MIFEDLPLVLRFAASALLFPSISHKALKKEGGDFERRRRCLGISHFVATGSNAGSSKIRLTSESGGPSSNDFSHEQEQALDLITASISTSGQLPVRSVDHC